MSKPNPQQMVNVQFARGSSIQAGKARHPWHWCILIQDGHLYEISAAFDTLGEAVADFEARGLDSVADIEKRLAEMYSHPKSRPYDLGVINSDHSQSSPLP